MLTLEYGSYEFALTPNIELNRQVEHDDSGDRAAEIETWTLQGELIAAEADSLASVIANFNSAFANDGLDLQLRNGQDLLLSLLAANCWQSPRIVETSVFADDEDMPFVRNARFKVQILGEKLTASGNVLAHRQEIEISEDVRKGMTKTVKGEFKVAEGGKASDSLNSVVPELTPGLKRKELTYETDADDIVLSYRVVDITEYEELPAEVHDGYIIESEDSSEAGNFKLMQGVFYGPGAKVQALALKPLLGLVSYKISENPQEQKVEFVYKQRLRGDGQSAQKKSQRISYQTKMSFKDFKLLAKDAQDCRQMLGSADFFVVQEGFAIGENSYPSPASPVQSSDVVERSIVYEFPEGAGSSRIYKTRWKFVMKPLKVPFEQGFTQN
ncbi:MAG: hypothetical protein K8S87_01695 [Planctomycetes bacterium]|nr:hypothetical protein [Planctomycetota bacterium]